MYNIHNFHSTETECITSDTIVEQNVQCTPELIVY